jgi:hypothetical protein
VSCVTKQMNNETQPEHPQPRSLWQRIYDSGY